MAINGVSKTQIYGSSSVQNNNIVTKNFRSILSDTQKECVAEKNKNLKSCEGLKDSNSKKSAYEMTKAEMMNILSAKIYEMYNKVKNGDTEQSFQIGGESFTIKEWDELMKKIDKNQDKIEEEAEEQEKKLEETLTSKEVK